MDKLFMGGKGDSSVYASNPMNSLFDSLFTSQS